MVEVRLFCGDCLDILPTLEADSVDSIVTDPPYGLEFMGKEWDHGVPGVPFWAECLRVAKPGAMLLAFGGTRTHHRLMCAIEDAGWEIRDCLMWLTGQGFPKSHDISKAIDKVNGEAGRLLRFVDWMRDQGLSAQQINGIIEKSDVGSHYLRRDQPAIPTADLWAKLRPYCNNVPTWVDELVERIEAEREVIGKHSAPAKTIYGDKELSQDVPITAPATSAAQLWDGWGTALKPSWEPIILAMKPLPGTFASNALTYGVAGLWVDGCRVATSQQDADAMERCNTPGSGRFVKSQAAFIYGAGKGPQPPNTKLDTTQGRWPANLVLSHTPECRRVGVRRVKNNGGVPNASSDKNVHPAFTSTDRTSTVHHFDPDGYETVDAWECAEDCPVRLLDEQSGESNGHKSKRDDGRYMAERYADVESGYFGNRGPNNSYADTGGASRFFYTAKASRSEREAGLLGRLPCLKCGGLDTVTHQEYNGKGEWREVKCIRNGHPTVKPLELCRWLCRLTKTPTGGVVLDPFLGSGSTLVAAVMEGRDVIGIEQERQSFEVAQVRIEAAEAEMVQASFA